MIRKRRSIHRSVSTSEKVNSVDEFCEVLWERLLVNSDDEGLQCGSLLTIKMTCLPGRDWSLEVLDERLHRLDDVGLITLYEVDGKPFVKMTAWEEHQSFHGIKRFPSEYPPPPDCQINGVAEHQTEEEVVYENPDTGVAEHHKDDILVGKGKGKGEGKGQGQEKKESEPSARTDLEGEPSPDSPEATKERVSSFAEEDFEAQLTLTLIDHILSWKPDCKVPDTPAGKQAWAKVFHLMVFEDLRDPEKICAVMDWLYSEGVVGEFAYVVESPASLRKKFDRISLAMTRKPTPAKETRHSKPASADDPKWDKARKEAQDGS